MRIGCLLLSEAAVECSVTGASEHLSQPLLPTNQQAVQAARAPRHPSRSPPRTALTIDRRLQALIIAELHDARALPPTRPARVCSAELRTPVPPLTVLEAGSQPARIPT